MSSKTSSEASNPFSTPSTGGSRRKGARSNVSRKRSASLSGGRRKRHGGQSAHQQVSGILGDLATQTKNTFDGHGNGLRGVAGQSVVRTVQGAPSGQAGGKKRRVKKGGYWGQVISNALVPFGLWAAQNRYSKRRTVKRGGKTRKYGKH